MLNQYGVASSLSGTSNVNSNTYNIAQSPLFFVRGGYVNLYYPSEPFRWAGSDGYYWSSRAYSDTSYAYYLYFDNSIVAPSYGNVARYLGFSLRCLIPTT